ncbi:MAG: hypothetical protein AAF943_17655 [Pseudomonadota bacterium]
MTVGLIINVAGLMVARRATATDTTADHFDVAHLRQGFARGAVLPGLKEETTA